MPWIYSPAMDLIIGCGAWSLPLLLLAYPFSKADLPLWTTAFYTLALVFNYPHYMATIYRAYHTKEDFQRYRLFTVYFTILAAAALIAAHWSYRLVPWLFTIYITWSPWHYMGQNFGLTMMFVRRNGIRMDRKDRNALWTAFVSSYLMIFLSFHTNPSQDPYVLSLGLPTLLDVFRIPLMAIFAVLGIWPLSKLVRKAGWKPMLPAITLYCTEFLWFVLPTVLELVTGARPPQARYSAGILAVMHSAQYLWITSYYARQEARASQSDSWSLRAYFATLIIGGMALFIPGPWLASYVLGRDFTASFLIFTALVNIHHFILDGAVWKLRETRVASLLTPKRKAELPHVTPFQLKPGSAWRFAGGVAIVMLVILAGVDQVRYYLASGQKSSTLSLATAINPYDSAVQTRLARVLIEGQRFDEAYAHYKQMFAHIRPDAPSLTNFGILCVKLNRPDEALTSFEQALKVDPKYAPAQRGEDLLKASP
jgi:hypothetical protein